VANQGVPLSPPDSATHLGSVTELDTVTGAGQGDPRLAIGDRPAGRHYRGRPRRLRGELWRLWGLGSVTQLRASTGIVLSQLSEPVSTIVRPNALAVDGTELFVADETNRSVTELDARSGTMRAVLSGSHYKIVRPAALAAAGPDLFVASAATGGGRGSLTESTSRRGSRDRADGFRLQVRRAGADGTIRAGPVRSQQLRPIAYRARCVDGGPGRVLSSSQYQFGDPTAIAVVGVDLFIASGTDGPLVEIDTSTGKLVKDFSGSEYQFDGPAAMLADGPDLFVTDRVPMVRAVRSSSWTPRRGT